MNETQELLAAKATKLEGFDAAQKEFTRAMVKNGDALAIITFTMYRDGSMTFVRSDHTGQPNTPVNFAINAIRYLAAYAADIAEQMGDMLYRHRDILEPLEQKRRREKIQ